MRSAHRVVCTPLLAPIKGSECRCGRAGRWGEPAYTHRKAPRQHCHGSMPPSTELGSNLLQLDWLKPWRERERETPEHNSH